MKILIRLLFVLIAYGSLFPFNFSSIEFSQNHTLLLSFKISGIGDVLGNILRIFRLGILYSLKSSSENSPDVKDKYQLWLWADRVLGI